MKSQFIIPDFFKLHAIFNRIARRVLMAEVSGGWVRGRPRLGWMNGVKATEE